LLRGAPSDEDPDDIESFSNQRLMRIGDTLSDVELSDAGSVTTDEEDESASDDDLNFGRALSRTSSTTSVEPIPKVSLGALASGGQDEEFKTEVRLSLERAFNEGHSIDNAAVELKTLRMASNVPIARVREAVVEGIVDRIPIVEGDTAQQRKEIAAMIDRWGSLITQIGGVDEVETIVTLQVRDIACYYTHIVSHKGIDSETLCIFGEDWPFWSSPSGTLPKRHRGRRPYLRVAC
jgi:translation initiation factor eIF-2B subunit epsilon